MGEERATVRKITEAEEAVAEMFKAIPKNKSMGYIGHFNDVMLCLSAVKRRAKKDEGGLPPSK